MDAWEGEINMSTAKIKPCPFCGEEASVCWRLNYNVSGGEDIIECNKCGVKIIRDSLPKAKRAWNRRAK
jgi:Lar family restriction alleviation protein